jgi:formylglycine-generating enzyme required for sulfatase activity
MPFVSVGGAAIEVLVVPPGEFLMGSPNAFFSEAPVHRVAIGSAFLLGKFPVTQRQWRAVMGSNPSAFTADEENPVEGVSWEDASAFCRRLGALSGLRFRLPSEAEWEYACRAGSAWEFFFGPWGPYRDDGEIPWRVRRALAVYAWFDLNSGDGTRPVGRKRPNPWGLHDLAGNVWEWCADVWHDDYAGAPADGSAWVEGAPGSRGGVCGAGRGT